MLAHLTQYVGQTLAATAPECWYWRGHPVRLVDGTTVAIPDTQANQRAYSQPCSQRPGLGFPLARVVSLICLGSEQQGARRRSTDFRQGRHLGVRDHLIELRKPKQKPEWMTPEHYNAAPEALTMRELATAGKILVTTLCCVRSRHQRTR